MTDDLVEQLLTAHRLPPVESQLLCDKAAARIGQQASRIALLEKAFEEHGGRYWEARYRDEAAEVERLREALRVMIYETTHLSPMEPDGSHWCRITADALNTARAALGESHD